MSTRENHRLDTDTRVHCYMDEFYCLGNFTPFRVVFDGIDYDTSEHAYHAQKFIHPSLREAIRSTRSAHDAFKLADSLRESYRPDWYEIRLGVMRDILLAKLDQHEYVRRKLYETDAREIVEDSWRDSFWGLGPNGDGENMLGKLWMEIRRDFFHRDKP